jgi:hypothetical protein
MQRSAASSHFSVSQYVPLCTTDSVGWLTGGLETRSVELFQSIISMNDLGCPTQRVDQQVAVVMDEIDRWSARWTPRARRGQCLELFPLHHHFVLSIFVLMNKEIS